jgi:hypothetical protein
MGVGMSFVTPCDLWTHEKHGVHNFIAFIPLSFPITLCVYCHSDSNSNNTRYSSCFQQKSLADLAIILYNPVVLPDDRKLWFYLMTETCGST